jgi:DNA repair protein RecO (recombination protein O)
MDERTHGLILRIRPLTETSLIVQWLTPELGRVATVAKGARRPKSPFRGKLDLFFSADFSFQRSSRSELHNLREVVLHGTNEALRKEMGYLQQASYCAALIEQTTETETPLPNIFRLMSGFLEHLPSRAPQPGSLLAFEIKLLSELGLMPNLVEARLSPGAQAILQKFSELSWADLSRLKLSDSQVTETTRFLHAFIMEHLGRIPRGRTAALVD